jgi:hypothetical protein
MQLRNVFLREIYSQHQTVPLAHTLLTIYHTCYCYYRKVRFPAVFSILKEQVKQTSKNSSRPPSQDLSKGFKPKEKKQGQKKAGGQPGHKAGLVYCL